MTDNQIREITAKIQKLLDAENLSVADAYIVMQMCVLETMTHAGFEINNRYLTQKYDLSKCER